MLDYQHRLLFYHPLGQLMPRKNITPVLQSCSWRKLLAPSGTGATPEALTHIGPRSMVPAGAGGTWPGVQAGGWKGWRSPDPAPAGSLGSMLTSPASCRAPAPAPAWARLQVPAGLGGLAAPRAVAAPALT